MDINVYKSKSREIPLRRTHDRGYACPPPPWGRCAQHARSARLNCTGMQNLYISRATGISTLTHRSLCSLFPPPPLPRLGPLPTGCLQHEVPPHQSTGCAVGQCIHRCLASGLYVRPSWWTDGKQKRQSPCCDIELRPYAGPKPHGTRNKVNKSLDTQQHTHNSPLPSD